VHLWVCPMCNDGNPLTSILEGKCSKIKEPSTENIYVINTVSEASFYASTLIPAL
jgi:hypothetical protein